MKRLLSFLLHDVYRAHPSESGFPGRLANRYKLSVAEFDAQIAGLARVRRDPPILVTEETPAHSAAVPFTITVDDGGLSYYTTVAERLEARGWRGHCFVTTGAIGHPGFLDGRQIRELHARGHVIGSHSVSHPKRFSGCRWNDMLREWRESREALADILGTDVTIAALPGGAFSLRAARAARDAGLCVLFTSEPQVRVDCVDGCTVLGRFAIRAGCPADFALRLGRLDAAPRLREWAVWGTKKRVKFLMAMTIGRRHQITTLASDRS